MEAGIYWLVGTTIVVFLLAIVAIGEAIKAIAKDAKSGQGAGEANS